MTGVTHQIKVAKCTESELDEVRNFLQDITHIVEENEHYEPDDDINKEIADVARKIPHRSFIVPFNLGILLDNYQDKESDILEHPKWIMDLFSVLQEIDSYLSDQKVIKSGSELHLKVKEVLK